MNCPACNEAFTDKHSCSRSRGDFYEKKVYAKQPRVCPVCGGNGLRPAGFYKQTTGQRLSANFGETEPCQSCIKGVVWEP